MTTHTHNRKVVVAGMGLVTPLGLDLASTWQGLLLGRSGIRAIDAFDASGLGAQIAGGVGAGPQYHSRLLRRSTRTKREHFAMRALDEALASAELAEEDLARNPLGVFTGCEPENSNDFSIFAEYELCNRDARDAVADRHRRILAARQPDVVGRAILERTPSARMFFNYVMACAAGAAAIHEALRWLRRGTIERALVLAVDTPINVGAVHGFEELGALSTHNEAPERACRPFDRNRDGFVLAEGAGAIVLETVELAASRTHRGHGHLLGGGMTNNQYQITRTPPRGEHAARAMRLALADAGLEPAQIGYINAHGTSTDVGDAGEVAAIRSVFETPPPTSSTKSMTGHMVTASGIVEMIIALMAVRDGQLPPTINQENPDPACELDCIPNVARAAAVRYALSNCFGFGGTNVSLVVGGAVA
jgi:3-oxoacyl-[acyl-carrier-protein] synthase II